MSLKANVLRDARGNITVHMEGDLNYDHSIPVREQISKIVNENPKALITIDLGGVDFVGSSGICHFVETIQTINRDKAEYEKVRVSNITKEFKKVFRLYTMEEADFFWDEFDMESDETNVASAFGARKRTFEN